MPNYIIDRATEIFEFIDNSNQQDFIEFAKQYDINIVAGSSFYNMVCNKIKERLVRDGLDISIIQP